VPSFDEGVHRALLRRGAQEGSASDVVLARMEAGAASLQSGAHFSQRRGMFLRRKGRLQARPGSS
jgi:hypothetical protein